MRQIKLVATFSSTREKAERAPPTGCSDKHLLPCWGCLYLHQKLMNGSPVSYPVAGSYFWGLAANKPEGGGLRMEASQASPSP